MCNLYSDEYDDYHLHHGGESDALEEIKTDELQDHNYRSLRVLDDFLGSLVNFLYCFVFVLFFLNYFVYGFVGRRTYSCGCY